MTSLRIATLGAALLLAPIALQAAESGDSWVTTKAKLAVLKATGTTGTKVEVTTNDGLATLSGKVSSEEDKKAAEKAVADLDGVKKVRNLLEVVKSKEQNEVAASDSEIKKNVEAELKADAALKGETGIEVESVSKGTVVLSGNASSLAKHLQAVEDARSVPGVKRVASTIESPDSKAVRDSQMHSSKEASSKLSATKDTLKSSKHTHKKDDADKTAASAKSDGKGIGDTMSDAYITTKVKAGLLTDSMTRGNSINVDTKDGVVTLFGTVNDEETKKHAEAQVSKMDGVTNVKNDLEIVPAGKADAVSKKDSDAERNVKKAVSDAKSLSDASISVEVRNGVARLTGTAPSEKARKDAEKIAMRADGVKSVRNEIEVRSE